LPSGSRLTFCPIHISKNVGFHWLQTLGKLHDFQNWCKN
jgi:hypothetical protein